MKNLTEVLRSHQKYLENTEKMHTYINHIQILPPKCLKEMDKSIDKYLELISKMSTYKPDQWFKHVFKAL